MKLKIGIVDYSIGNWGSIKNALYKLGFNPIISQNSHQLRESDLLILPGVGAFPPAIQAIKKRDLDKFLCEMAVINKPIIGICLGMQLLFKKSYEFKETKGLNLVNGDVKKFKNNKTFVTHLGWNKVFLEENEYFKYFKKFEKKNFYFVHSYFVKPTNKNEIFAKSNMATKNFAQ